MYTTDCSTVPGHDVSSLNLPPLIRYFTKLHVTEDSRLCHMKLTNMTKALVIVMTQVLLILLAMNTVLSEDEPEIIDIPRGNDVVVDQELVPLYAMARGFLTNLVQREDLQYMEDKGVDFTDFNGIVSDHVEDWVQYFLGYAIWSGIGVLMLVVMVVTGVVMLCCCCCSCCCSSGKKSDKATKETKNSSCCRFTLSIILFLLTTAMLPPVMFMVISGIRLRQQVQSEENMFDTVRDGIQELDRYTDATMFELETEILGSVDILNNDILNELALMETNIYNDLNNQTGAYTALMDLNELNSDLNRTYITVNLARPIAISLTQERIVLRSDLSNIANIILISIAACTTDSCNQVKVDVENLVPNATYRSTSAELIVLDNGISPIVENDDLEAELNRTQDEYNEVLQSIESDVSTISADATEMLDDSYVNMENYIEDVTAKVEEFDFDSAFQEVDDIEDDAYTPADILFWSIVGICALIVLIIVWNYIGILIGVCCSAGDSSTCNRAVGSTVLKVGVVMTFLVQWLFMILLIVTFLGSGILYTEFCRHMVAYNESAVADIMDDILEGTVLDTVDVNLVVSDVYTDCGKDMAFYTAFDLDQNNLNITEIVYDPRLDEEIDKLRDYDVGHNFAVEIMSPDLDAILGNISVSYANYEFFESDLNADVVALDVDEFINDLNAILDDDGVNEAGLSAAIEGLETLNNLTINPMEIDKAELINYLEEIETYIWEGNHVDDLQGNLQTAEDNINNSNLTNEIMEGNRDDTVTEVERMLDETRQSIEYNVETTVGRCFSVYHVIANVTDEVCVKTLYPVLGFWFSLGWCYILLIVCLILSLNLAAQLRKTVSKEKTSNLKKSVPNYQAKNQSRLDDEQDILELSDTRNSMVGNILDSN